MVDYAAESAPDWPSGRIPGPALACSPVPTAGVTAVAALLAAGLGLFTVQGIG